MGLFDGLLGNLGNVEEIAAKLGVDAGQIQPLMDKLTSGDIAGLMQAAQAQGIDMAKIQELMGGADMQELMGKATAMLGGGNLGDMLGGMFGKD